MRTSEDKLACEDWRKKLGAFYNDCDPKKKGRLIYSGLFFTRRPVVAASQALEPILRYKLVRFSTAQCSCWLI
jgi:hypothetical protein